MTLTTGRDRQPAVATALDPPSTLVDEPVMGGAEQETVVDCRFAAE
jgi:hypothetical protein